MKVVNRNVRVKSGKIGKTSTARPEKSGKRGKSEKVPCFDWSAKQIAMTKETLLPLIPGVEQLEDVIPESKLVVGGFYVDEAELLVRRAKGFLDRSAIYIAPKTGWPKSIYRKPETK